MLSVAQAELLGLILHTLLLGVYVALFIQSLPFSTDDHEGFRNRLRASNRGLLVANLLLFVTIVAHWLVQIVRSQRAFIDTAGEPLLEGHDPATLYYATPQNYMNLLKESLYLIQTFIGDCTMVYRAWIVWNRRWLVIVPPCLVMCGFTIAAIAVVVALGRLQPGQDIFASAANYWAVTVFTTSVTVNIITTSMIVYRIRSIQKQVTAGQENKSRVMSVLIILIESALLYTLTATATLIGYAAKQNWQFITIDMISPIIGISFTLIVVRVQKQSENGSTSRGPISSKNRTNGPRRSNAPQDVALHAISVNVTQEVDRDYEADANSSKDDALDRKVSRLA